MTHTNATMCLLVLVMVSSRFVLRAPRVLPASRLRALRALSYNTGQSHMDSGWTSPRAWLVAAACLAMAVPQSTPAQTPQQPTFRATVDMVAVDVQVVDRNGTPLSTLGNSDF